MTTPQTGVLDVLEMRNSEPTSLDQDRGRILRFRPRNSPRPISPVRDLRQYQQGAEPDDFRHRMKMNALALMVIVVLIAIGVWIADTMADMRKKQDCALTGSGCTPIKVPIVPR